MQLPVELLLVICHFLGAPERQSLAHTCRAMSALINAKAPFQNSRLTRGGTSELLSLYLHSRVLAFATEIHWNPEPERRRGQRHSTDSFTVVGLSFRLVLSALQTSSSLRLLEIHRLEVSSSHQRIILSVPTLRELILDQSIFIPTTAKMPSSSITSLTFVPGASEQAPAAYLLKLLSESLEVLDAGYTPRTVYSTLLTMRFPRLVSLRHRSQDLNALTVLTSHVSITKLYIPPFLGPEEMDFPHDVLPQLRELASPWWVAEQLVPGRPVQVSSDTGRRALDLDELNELFMWPARSTRDIEELHVGTRSLGPKVFTVLAKHLPRLKRLKLWTRTNTVKGAMWRPLEKCPPAITDVEIRFQRSPRGPLPSRISRHCCHWVLCMTAKACPALETAMFAAPDPEEPDIEEREIPPAWKFKARKTSRGEWEEQRETLLAPSEEESALEDSLRNVVSTTTPLFVCE